MFNIVARLDRKVSDGNYGSSTLGVILTQEGLELKSAEEVAKAADELFRLAKEAVDRQVGGNGAVPAAKASAPQPAPSNGNGSNGNGHTAAATAPSNGNGTGNGRRSYGRPKPGTEATPRQKQYLKTLARSKGLGPESIREIIQRILPGKDPRNLDRHDLSVLIEALLAQEQAA